MAGVHCEETVVSDDEKLMSANVSLIPSTICPSIGGVRSMVTENDTKLQIYANKEVSLLRQDHHLKV